MKNEKSKQHELEKKLQPLFKELEILKEKQKKVFDKMELLIKQYYPEEKNK